MVLFKTLESKIRDGGFLKVKDDDYGITYEKYNKEHDFIHMVELLYEDNKQHITIRSYNLLTDNLVPLTVNETSLFINKANSLVYNIFIRLQLNLFKKRLQIFRDVDKLIQDRGYSKITISDDCLMYISTSYGSQKILLKYRKDTKYIEIKSFDSLSNKPLDIDIFMTELLLYKANKILNK